MVKYWMVANGSTGRPEQPPATTFPESPPPEAAPPQGADTPPEQTPPGADTPRTRHPPPGRPKTATVSDGTHPTGMHSCRKSSRKYLLTLIPKKLKVTHSIEPQNLSLQLQVQLTCLRQFTFPNFWLWHTFQSAAYTQLNFLVYTTVSDKYEILNITGVDSQQLQGPAYNDWQDANDIIHCKRTLIVIKLYPSPEIPDFFQYLCHLPRLFTLAQNWLFQIKLTHQAKNCQEITDVLKYYYSL